MTAETWKSLEEKGAIMDLSTRAKFRLTGGDRERYLNGQVTNDVRKATSDRTLQACVTNAKGRIEAEVFIHASADGQALLVDAAPGLRETLAARLERYIVADDVTLEDVTEDWMLLHTCGEAIPAASRLHSLRLGIPGHDYWLPASAGLPSFPTPLLSAEDQEVWRILQGIPSWPQELNPDTFPQEAGLETSAMDFAKGCYIGQEILSRIKTTGKMPRVLRGIRAPKGVILTSGMKLVEPKAGEEMKETGVVTSAARHPVLDQWVGLAYVRQAFEAVDSLLLAGGDPPRILGDVEIFFP